MNFLVPLVMFGWIPVVLYLFKQFPAQRAVVISFIAAWLFLPQASYQLLGLPDYTKMSATCYGILLATFIYDVGRFSSFRFGWLDLPMLIWCLCPIASSLDNGLGLYDGISSALAQTVAWGVPYFLGRLYLSDLNGLRRLATGIFIGGLVYMPLCLYEIRMSPQLHRMVYGYFARTDFAQTIRYGGFRPTVFMAHGLEVGAWMMAATLIGVWLWRAGIIKQLWSVPMKWVWFPLLITFILVKSTGAWLLLGIGLLVLYCAKWFRNPILLVVLMVGIVSYVSVTATGNFTTDRQEAVVSFIAETINEDRAQSLDFRFKNEEVLGDKAREQPIFGWGGWGRARVYDEWGKDISVTDSLWIIAFGNHGLVGLASLVAFMLVPVVRFVQLYPANQWFSRSLAPVAALSVVLALYTLDCVLNALVNPIFALACGGLTGWVMREPVLTTLKGRLRNSTRRPIRGDRRYIPNQSLSR